jgi:asparagine synthase (glutamine-hydrolysing)
MCGIFFYYSQKVVYDIKNISEAYETVKPRGPENTTIQLSKNCIYCFHRLAINNTSENCNQPFQYTESVESGDLYTYRVMCNGEIYNWKQLQTQFNLTLTHENDCGVIYPLFKHFNFNFEEMLKHLDGEFAIVIVKENDQEVQDIWFSTDLCSVRPLFYTFDEVNNIIVISSLLSGIANINQITSVIKRADGGIAYHLNKSLVKIKSCIYDYKFLMKKQLYSDVLSLSKDYYIVQNNDVRQPDDYFETIVEKLTSAVYKRISNDNKSRPLGCLLSGGLDSSLVASIAAKFLSVQGDKLHTFSIGMKGSTDLYYAKKVADFIGSHHTEVFFTAEEGIDAIDNVIKTTETYDITTIRASVGQFLLSKWIAENTDIKILLNGDGADECQMGYLYFYKAPSDLDAQVDSVNLLKQIHYFDGLRVDRNISHHGLEARVPFLDKDFVNYFLNEIPAKYKIPEKFNCEKYMIRKAFEKYNILPSEVLWRRKEAFSDGVSSVEKSWFEILLENFEKSDVSDKLDRDDNAPYTRESCYYRLKFEEYFKERNSNVIPRFWLPSWTSEKDPSARKLKEIYTKEN